MARARACPLSRHAHCIMFESALLCPAYHHTDMQRLLCSRMQHERSRLPLACCSSHVRLAWHKGCLFYKSCAHATAASYRV
eukprot:6201530-Pleurochrysis_carterae.AAC.2